MVKEDDISEDEIEVPKQSAAVEPKTEDETKRDKEHGADDGPKKKPYQFKQIARKKGTKKGGKVQDKHEEEEVDQLEDPVKVIEEKLVRMLKKRRAPMGESLFFVKEKPEQGAAQSISQSAAQSVVQVPKVVAIEKQPKIKKATKGVAQKEVVPFDDVGDEEGPRIKLTTRQTVMPLMNLV
uniref:Uncharacterized protein n=1 Tax=Chenopodium quinoa TaxID=63459 RepID=A0A803MS23_CHEQI